MRRIRNIWILSLVLLGILGLAMSGGCSFHAGHYDHGHDHGHGHGHGHHRHGLEIEID